MTNSSRAVFLDRDGTLNVDPHFVTDPSRVELVPGALDGVRMLRAEGSFRLIVYSNQSGIARGMLDERTLAAINGRVHELLECAPHAYLHCPHHPTEGDGPYTRACSCRKPADGLLRDGAALFGIDLSASFAIGDSARDLIPALQLGMRGFLVRTGKPIDAQLEELRRAGVSEPEGLVVDDLPAAAREVLAT